MLKSGLQNSFASLIGLVQFKLPCRLFSIDSTCKEMPRKLKRAERKPWVTSINDLKHKARLQRRARQEVSEITLRPPENGLLVKALVPFAQEVYAARAKLFTCALMVLKSTVVYSCRLCGEVHVGHPPHEIRTCNVRGSPATKEHVWEIGGVDHVLPAVESFHLYDRLGRAVSHNERLQVDRIPAIVELCIQAGLDIPEYPTRRRTFPVYNVAGKMIDFERRFPKCDLPGKDIDVHGFWEKRNQSSKINSMHLLADDILGTTTVQSDDNWVFNVFIGKPSEYATQGMEAWEKMLLGASKLMQKYAVQTCGYCSEVQVGPKGHRVRNCQAYKHQMRDGQHAWQKATVDDLIPPVHVWHVHDVQDGGLLVNGLKRYYGKLPAVVELFEQAGANVGETYVSMMREDVAVPELDEEKWVV